MTLGIMNWTGAVGAGSAAPGGSNVGAGCCATRQASAA